jgi:Cys-rich protein (TIGR01571 family)
MAEFRGAGLDNLGRVGDFGRAGVPNIVETTRTYKAEWDSGLMEIFAPVEGSCELCCQAFFCPCHVFDKNKAALTKLRPESIRNSPFNNGCRAWFCFSSTTLRNFIREQRGIKSSGDCCAIWFCPCCALIQEANEVHRTLSLQWPWKDPPVVIVTKQLPSPSPIRKPAPVQQEAEVKYVQRPAQRPGLCPVFIPKDFHSLPDEGLVKAEILPYSSVPFDFRPLNEDASTQRSWPFQRESISSTIDISPSYQPGMSIPMIDGGLQSNDRFVSQSYISGPGLQLPAAAHPPVAHNTMGGHTMDLNQALYTGGKDYWS